ncbi:MAG: D-aminoacylase, partial [Planctomycetes bacterium]|nr:D-aminoacylase [Planctomycetota bacterium]
MFDILIRNGKVVDGTGNPWQFGDVGIEKGKIAAIGKLSSSTEAKRVLDASGLVVAPGFIDVHTHSDVILLKEPRHESRIRP